MVIMVNNMSQLPHCSYELNKTVKNTTVNTFSGSLLLSLLWYFVGILNYFKFANKNNITS